MKTVAKGIQSFLSKHNAIILVTHYQRILGEIKPDFVHILSQGKIVRSGDYALAMEIEQQGYENPGHHHDKNKPKTNRES